MFEVLVTILLAACLVAFLVVFELWRSEQVKCSGLQKQLEQQKQELAKTQEELQKEKTKPHYENAEHKDREDARRAFKMQKLVVVDVDSTTSRLCGVRDVEPTMADYNKYTYVHGNRTEGRSGLLAKQILGEGEYSIVSPLGLSRDTEWCVYMVIRRGQFGPGEVQDQQQALRELLFKMAGANDVPDILKKWGVVLPPTQ